MQNTTCCAYVFIIGGYRRRHYMVNLILKSKFFIWCLLCTDINHTCIKALNVVWECRRWIIIQNNMNILQSILLSMKPINQLMKVVGCDCIFIVVPQLPEAVYLTTYILYVYHVHYYLHFLNPWMLSKCHYSPLGVCGEQTLIH